MFLNQLAHPVSKALFLELATLVMMAEEEKGSIGERVSQIAEETDSNLYPLLISIQPSEEEMLYAYEKEADLEINDFDSVFDKNQSDFIEKYILNAVPNNFDEELKYIDSNDGFQPFIKILSDSTSKIIIEFTQDETIKKQIIEKLITNGEDILKLSPQMTRRIMVSLPEIKEQILKLTAKKLLESRSIILNNATNKERKIIAFELLGAGYSSGRFEDAEKRLVAYIYELLDVDAEYLEEFGEVMGRMFAINKEAADLINE